jgi:hypothetical protein
VLVAPVAIVATVAVVVVVVVAIASATFRAVSLLARGEAGSLGEAEPLGERDRDKPAGEAFANATTSCKLVWL